MRLIDADKLKETLKNSGAHHSIRKYIDSQPRVDAELVVHCKDCKYRNTEYGMHFCGILRRNTHDTFYCRNGSKIDEEAEQ